VPAAPTNVRSWGITDSTPTCRHGRNPETAEVDPNSDIGWLEIPQCSGPLYLILAARGILSQTPFATPRAACDLGT
jgi:hypothetical protein